MVHSIHSAGLQGIESFLVQIEVVLSKQGMPSFTMVGLAETAVREAQDRVLTALRSCGYTLPVSKIVVNLAPADKKKSGSGYDMALAIGILCSIGVIEQEDIDSFLFVGELSLSGRIKGISGILPMTLLAREKGLRGIFVPHENSKEASIVEGLDIYPVETLDELVSFLRNERTIMKVTSDSYTRLQEKTVYRYDFTDVKGQEHAKRAIEIAAAGDHNMLFIGPPGSGKTMLSQRIPSVLPPLTFEEALEVTKIYSVMDLLQSQGIITTRPFRSPHHTISESGLIGGGRIPKPGEVSLAHCGVLFLDELLEFNRHTLDVLRQPLESGLVTIARAFGSLTFPAQFMLIAAMNPCPCGYRTDPTRECTCSAHTVARYKSRLSGPMLDRIDLHIEVPAVPYSDLAQGPSAISSERMRTNIMRAKRIQQERYQDTDCKGNAYVQGALFEEHCAMGTAEQAFLERAVHSLRLSARAYTKIIRIARTIADLEEAHSIAVPHLAEAISCRALDRDIW